VIRDGAVLDVTSFTKYHPGKQKLMAGGEGMLMGMNGRDITDEFKAHKVLSYHLADSMAIGSLRG